MWIKLSHLNFSKTYKAAFNCSVLEVEIEMAGLCGILSCFCRTVL